MYAESRAVLVHEVVLEHIFLVRIHICQCVPPAACRVVTLHGIVIGTLPVGEFSCQITVFVAFVLVVEIAQHQGHATVGIIIDTVMGARRHCLIHDRLRLEYEFVVLHFDEQVLGLELSVGTTHDYTDLVYRCITGIEPFPDGWLDRKFPEILLLARLPFAFVNVFFPFSLDEHPLRLNHTDMGIQVSLVIIERGFLVRPVIKHARSISLRQFRNRKKSCSRRIYKFIYRMLSHIYDSGLVSSRGKRNGRCPQFLVVFRNCDNDIARTGSRCLVYFKPVILGDCSRPL